MNWHAWLLWPDSPVGSIVALLLAAWTALYLARVPVHRLLGSLTHSLHGTLRLGAHWLLLNARELRDRNRSVLLAHGRDELGQRIEREIERIDAAVRRDLQGYPSLQRKLLDRIRSLEQDYRDHADAPPEVPEWTKVTAAMARIRPNGDPVVSRIVADLQQTVTEAHAQALREYAKSYASRHRALARLQPELQVLSHTLGSLDTNVAELRRRAAELDTHIARYAEMHRRSDRVERALTKSAAIQLVLALVVLVGAGGGMALNFSLIALPLSEIIDSNRYFGQLPASDLAALTLIGLEAVMGLVLMESLRLTHLVPHLSYLGEHARRRLVIVALVFLLLFAGVEVALALIHNKVAAIDPLVNSSLLVSKLDIVIVNAWLGLLLPFALAFVAIPLEALLYALRAMSGVVLVTTLKLAAFALRLAGNLIRYAGNLTLRFYDVLIFVPLALERLTRLRFAPDPDAAASIPAKR